MRIICCGLVVGLLLFTATHGDDGKPDAERLRKELVGTWEVVTPEIRKGFRDLKHITPTHFTWIIYSEEEMAPYATAGGTWSLEGNQYRERCEFSTKAHAHLRGKEATLTVKIDGDKLFLEGVLDTGFKINEVWKRAAAGVPRKKE
jgi:hypothetical protein